MILLFWKYSNNVIHLLFPQKQEGSNKVIRKSSVATLFGVRNEELKAVEVMVVLSGDVKQSCWLDEHQRMKEIWCFNSLDIIGILCHENEHLTIQLPIQKSYRIMLLQLQERSETSSNVQMLMLPPHEAIRILASSEMWRLVVWRILFDVSEEPSSFNSGVNYFN